MKFIARSDTTMTTYNNIRTARSPITGMTIAEVAHWTRWCETDEGKAMSAAISREWAAVEPANEGTVVDAQRTILEAQHRLAASHELDNQVDEWLKEWGL
ncbi:MAG: hypothetical protein ACO3YZ_06820 [Candidatus Nanopelagicaceae bacterium]